MVSDETRRGRKFGIKRLLSGMRLDDPASSVDGSVPKLVHGVPNEVIFPNRIREASVRAFLILEFTLRDLVVQRSVREKGPRDERVTGIVSGSWVSKHPLVAIDELRAVRETVMGEEDPFFPADTLLVVPVWVGADLGLEEGGGGCAVGKRDVAVTRAVVVDCGGVW